MVRAEALRPDREPRGKRRAKARSTIQFHAVSLTIVEAKCLDLAETLQRPGEAGGAVLPAAEEHQRALRSNHDEPSFCLWVYACASFRSGGSAASRGLRALDVLATIRVRKAVGVAM